MGSRMLLVLALLPLVVQSASPVCTFVLPSATSSLTSDVPANGNSASKAKHHDPGHFVCVPTVSPPRGLMVFMPGLAATDYTLFAQAAASTDLAVIVVSSEACSLPCCSASSPLNCTATDPVSVKKVQECYHDNRQMHLLGNDTAPSSPYYPATSSSNSITGRTKALITFLARNASFRSLGGYLDEAGSLEWKHITVGGHSCASYYPVIMAALYPVERMVMTGGVGGSLVGFDLHLKVSVENRYGLVMSSPDCQYAANGSRCFNQCRACQASGSSTCTFAADEGDYTVLQLPGQAGVFARDMANTDPALARALDGARQLFDRDVCVYPGRVIMTHLCQICDLQTHRYENGTAVLAPVWRYLVANKLPPTGTALADNVTCNNTTPSDP